jgi:uncharacterized membrane protein
MTPTIATNLAALLPIVFISLILPWFATSRRGILFGVTVPLDFAESPQARTALHRFRLGIGALILFVLAAVLLIFWLAPTINPSMLVATIVPLELIAAYILWRRGNTALKPFAAAIPIERHADLVPISTTAPLLLIALSLLPIAATALWLRLHWNQIASRWPQHWNATGAVDGWAFRTTPGVFGLLLAGALAVLFCIALALFISRASGPQSRERRRALLPMAALSWLIAGMVCVVASLPLTHLSSSSLLIVNAIYLSIVFAISFWLLHRSGLSPNSQTTEPYDSTPDSKWHAGIIYYNPADAAIIVPKRFGWGWTLNFARPAAWAYIAAVLVFVAAITLVPDLMK